MVFLGLKNWELSLANIHNTININGDIVTYKV